MARRTPGCELVKSVIPKSIHQWGPAVEKEYLMHSVCRHWDEIVGQMIAANVRAVGVERRILWLSCYNASWRNEIMMRQLDILDRVNRYAGSNLVRELRFCSPKKQEELQHPETAGREKTLEELQLGRALPKLSLTEDEQQKAREVSGGLKDDDLRRKICALYQKQLKLEKFEREHDWHPCARCGAQCAKEQEYCSVCRRAVRSELEQKVRQFLRDMPWARYGDVYEYVKCPSEMVNLQRVRLVQALAARVETGDTTSLDAKTLVMLYRCVPPEQLTDELVESTLYRLRNDLRKPKDFRPRRRYEVLGRKRPEQRGNA